MRRLVAVATVLGATAVVQQLVRRYRLDQGKAYARLDKIDRHLVETRFGVIEYADSGAGPPCLAIHGFLGGCDQALLALRGFASGRRIIAPSRFGYLGSTLPADATPADQADAFAQLLDAIGVDRVDVLAISSGATSAFQLALRHPDRVTRLVVISGNMPGGAAAVAPAKPARLLFRDAPLWTLTVLARPIIRRQVGVPPGLPLRPADEQAVTDLVDTFFPLAARADGAVHDAFTSDPAVNGFPLEAITVPTLIVHAKDDPMVAYEAARRAAVRIPGARLVPVEAGGHLLLGGHREAVAANVVEFLSTSPGAVPAAG